MHYLVVDLEAACSDDGTVPKHEMEIIEIDAVMVNGNTLQSVDEFQTFVRPVRHPVLTKFCTSLTSITQADLTGAPLFPEALRSFSVFARSYGEVLFSSWGDYDAKQLRQDCLHHGLTPPFAKHWNVKLGFSQQQGLTKKLGMAEALKHAGLTLEGSHHRGIDDARNIARLLPFALGKRRAPGR